MYKLYNILVKVLLLLEPCTYKNQIHWVWETLESCVILVFSISSI